MTLADVDLRDLPDAIAGVVPAIQERAGIAVSFRLMDEQASDRLGPFAQAFAVTDIDAEHQSITIWLAPGAYRTHTITHELLHLQRDILDSVPRWMPAAEAPAHIRDFVWQMDVELEHLFIVPQELELHPEAESFWTTHYETRLAAAALREDGFELCLHWAFLRTSMSSNDAVARRCAEHLRALSNHRWLRIANNYQCELRDAMPCKSALMAVQFEFLSSLVTPEHTAHFMKGRYVAAGGELRVDPVT